MGTKILVVDDEIGIRELLSEILSDEGYGVLLAENASAARSAMRKQLKCFSLKHLNLCFLILCFRKWTAGRFAVK